MNNVNRKNRSEKVFVCIWVIYSTVYIWAGVSALPNTYPFVKTIYSVVANCTIIALFILFLVVKRYSLSSLFFYILFILLVLLIEVSIADRTLLISILFLINAPNINVIRLMMVDVKLKITLLIFMLFLYVVGITENITFIIGDVHKHSLGFNNPNMLAAYVLTIILEWLCLHYGAIKKYQYFIIFIFVYIVNYVSKARTSIYTFLIVFMLFILANFIPQIFCSNIMKVILGLLTPALAVLSFFFSYLYLRGNTFAVVLNKITTGRLKYAAYALSKYEVKLIGQPIDTIFTSNGNSNLILDNAYVYGVLHYGMIFFVFLCIMYSVLFIKLIKHRQINMMLLGMFYVVTGLGEKFMYTAIFNISMLYLLYVDEQMETVGYSFETTHNRFKIRFLKK